MSNRNSFPPAANEEAPQPPLQWSAGARAWVRVLDEQRRAKEEARERHRATFRRRVLLIALVIIAGCLLRWAEQ